jgi:hypothetical protein
MWANPDHRVERAEIDFGVEFKVDLVAGLF